MNDPPFHQCHDLSVITTKSTYTGGDTIFGVVYLKVSEPTTARGIQLHLQGYENYHCPPPVRNEGEMADRFRVLQDHREYYDEQLLLYQTQCPLSMKHYMFPFCYELPSNIPGSFHMTGSNWECKVVHMLEVSMIGAESPKVQIPINVVSFREPSTSFLTTCTDCKISWRKKFTVEASINTHRYTFGDFIKLNLNFSGDYKSASISLIQIQLYRQTSIHCGSGRFILQERDTSLVQKVRDIISCSTSRGTQAGLNPNNVPNGPEWVQPEGTAAQCVHSIDLNVMENPNIRIDHGIRDIHIPLKDKDTDGQPNPPSIHGHFLKCYYYLDIIIHCGRKKVKLQITVPNIHKTGFETKEPAWADRCELFIDNEEAPIDPVQDREHFQDFPCVYNKLSAPTFILD